MQQDTHYTLDWAYDVVKQYDGDHTRATEYLYTFCNLEPIDIAFVLARDQEAWNRWKSAVKYVENVQKRTEHPLSMWDDIAKGLISERIINPRRVLTRGKYRATI